MPETELETRFATVQRRVMLAGVALATAIAAMAMLGWVTGVQRLSTLVPDAPRMSANTAICLLLLCGSLWLIREPTCSRRNHVWARLLAAVAVAYAGISLLEYIAHFETHVDDLFEADSASPYAGHMSPHTAAVVICTGLWLMTMDLRGRRSSRLADLLAPLAGLGILAALIGWLYGVNYINGAPGEPGIAPQTVVALVALIVAILAARPRAPWMGLVAGPGAGGHVMRRFVPLLLGGSIVAGYALIWGVEHDLWTVSVGTAFVIAGLVTVLLGGLVQTSRELEEADQERRRLQERLTDLADRDPLTNVFNRRRFDEELESEFALHRRYGLPVGVLTIDLDDFKLVNDTHGHAVGDELLLATTEVLAEGLRASDVVARFGGDEFMVLLPGIGADATSAVADKLVQALRGVSRTAADGTAIRLRASIGVAHTDRAGWPSPEELLIAADKALYLAKREGGDRFATDAELVVN